MHAFSIGPSTNHDTTAHLDGFQHGWVNPVVAYLTACVGAAIGLRCTARAMTLRPNRRSGWLALAAGAFGCGIWSMHYTAMAAVTVTPDGRPLGGGTPASQFALPLAVGIMVVLAVAGIAIALSPQDPEPGEGPAAEPIRVDLFGQERY